MKLSDKTIDYLAKSAVAVAIIAICAASVVCQAAPLILTGCLLSIGECPLR